MPDTATEPQKIVSPDVPKWTGFSSCDDLPLSVFIDCLLEEEFYKLIISIEGDITPQQYYQQWPEDIYALWLKLYSEYCELSNNDAIRAIIAQIWELKCMEGKIIHVKGLLALLLKHRDGAVVEVLALRGYIVPLYINDDTWEANIRRLQAQLKGEEFKLRKLDELLQSLKQTETTKADFRKQLIVISKHNGYKLSIAELKTAEYCDYLNTFREDMDQLKALNDGG